MVLTMEAASTRARSTDHAATLREALKTTVMDTDTGEAAGDFSDNSVCFEYHYEYNLKCAPCVCSVSILRWRGGGEVPPGAGAGVQPPHQELCQHCALAADEVRPRTKI